MECRAHAYPLSLYGGIHFDGLKQIDRQKVAILTIQEFAAQI